MVIISYLAILMLLQRLPESMRCGTYTCGRHYQIDVLGGQHELKEIVRDRITRSYKPDFKKIVNRRETMDMETTIFIDESITPEEFESEGEDGEEAE